MAAFSNWLGQLFDDSHLHADDASLNRRQKIHHPFLSEDDLGTDLIALKPPKPSDSDLHAEDVPKH